MRTIIGPREEGSVATVATSGGEDTAPATITTTLYDLIAALQEVVEPGEGGTLNCAPSADAVAGNDGLVVATVVAMLRAGRIRRVGGGWGRDSAYEPAACRRQEVMAREEHQTVYGAHCLSATGDIDDGDSVTSIRHQRRGCHALGDARVSLLRDHAGSAGHVSTLF